MVLPTSSKTFCLQCLPEKCLVDHHESSTAFIFGAVWCQACFTFSCVAACVFVGCRARRRSPGLHSSHKKITNTLSHVPVIEINAFTFTAKMHLFSYLFSSSPLDRKHLQNETRMVDVQSMWQSKLQVIRNEQIDAMMRCQSCEREKDVGPLFWGCSTNLQNLTPERNKEGEKAIAPARAQLGGLKSLVLMKRDHGQWHHPEAQEQHERHHGGREP